LKAKEVQDCWIVRGKWVKVENGKHRAEKIVRDPTIKSPKNHGRNLDSEGNWEPWKGFT
jgi:hypothetical protein